MSAMRLFEITRKQPIGRGDYDVFTAAIVAAENAGEACRVHPMNRAEAKDAARWSEQEQCWIDGLGDRQICNENWVKPSEVEAKLVGLACISVEPHSAVLSRFRAG
jgi:hypothetical protein